MAPRRIELQRLAEMLSAGSRIRVSRGDQREGDVQHGSVDDHARIKSAYTAHGFRSAFRDWASERTNFAREICEVALAHIVKDKTEAAYRRVICSKSDVN